MVSKRVTVKSLAFGEKQAYVWQSEGVEGYTMDTCEKDTVGTEITLELLDDVAADAEGNGGENYSEFLDQYRIQSLVKRYSDYIRFPICMDMTKSRKKEDSDEYEEYVENVTLNSMVPLWHKNKNEISEEEYNSFYKDKCGVIRIRCAICMCGTKVPLLMMPCCISRPILRSTTTARTTKRACSCMPTVC